MSTDRILIHTAIADKFLAAFKEAIAEMAASSSAVSFLFVNFCLLENSVIQESKIILLTLHKPPIVVSAASQTRLKDIVSDALSRGAHLLTANEETEHSGSIFTPTIIGQVNPGMKFSQEEAFGPLAGYIIVQSEDEAIELANATEYGLTASVFTRDLRKAFAIAKRLESG